MVVKSN